MPPFGLPQNNILRRAVGGGQQSAVVRRARTAGASPQQGRAERPGLPELGQAAPAALPEAARRGRSNREVLCENSTGSTAATGSGLGKDSAGSRQARPASG